MSGPWPSEPEIVAFQRRCDGFYPPDAVSAPVAQQREWYDALCREFDPGWPKGIGTVDRPIEGVRCRHYRPARIEAAATVLYLHGGGFVVGSLDSHDAICAEIAASTYAEVVAVDYRLAPEHRWPAAFDDGMAVLRGLIGEERSVVLAGDSAGGNLAAGLAIRARDEGLAGIGGQALIYPGLGGDLVSGSYAEMADAPGLATADVRYYRDLYGAPEGDPVAYPLRAASLAGLPPAYVTAARFDPLRDDARRYAARLAGAGVDVSFREEPQMVHAWLRARHMSPGARVGFAALCAGIAALARRPVT
ncbi:alpha/beta hydrolase [Aureimonas leprariae]|uniref:Alpha/beta hydrolase n=1 Tax=Plantimonas leprariae TaxID=2615207 RepID=A0A7V7TYA1_9HYPH|nr:alpha/beta hydrolase [Aureimonas leprariae]KAB0682531.1 alpha/beta hydrolase [Aureimonas leprariae]